jgi:hypothetical protein
MRGEHHGKGVIDPALHPGNLTSFPLQPQVAVRAAGVSVHTSRP